MSSPQIQYQESVAVSITVFSSLSVVGSAFVVLTYVFFKPLRNFALKMVAYLCAADFLNNVTTYLIVPFKLRGQGDLKAQNTTLCHVQAYLRILADLASILWSVLLSVGVYLTVVKNNRNLSDKECTFLVIGYLIPIVFALGPLFFSDVGPNTYYCWLQDELTLHNYLYEVLFLYGPLWIGIVVIFTLNVRVQRTLARFNLSSEDMQSFRRILYYPIVLVVCGVFSTASFIMELAGVFPNAPWLQFLSYSLNRSQGLFNAIIFGFTPAIRSQIVYLVCVRARRDASKSLNNSSRSSKNQLDKDMRDLLLDDDENFSSQNVHETEPDQNL